jgi:hypothetical protein
MAVRDGTAVIDVASGRVTRTLRSVSPASPSFAHWRLGRPSLVIAGYGCDRGSAHVVTLDDLGASERTVLDTGDSCDRVDLRDPRWNPQVRSELLYVRASRAPGREAFDYSLHVLDVDTGRDRTLPISTHEATWTWAGTEIAYIAKDASRPFGSVVLLANHVDGSGQRELLRAEPGASFFSIASVAF